MNEVMWIKFLNEGISLFLLLIMGFGLFQGLKRNQTFLSEREELLKRYLLFRGDQQVRLKIYGGDERISQELLRNLSNSWKNFKKYHDQYFHSLAKNATKTKRFLQLITLCLLVNSFRLLVEKYFFIGLKADFIYTVLRELSSYVLVVLSFYLLRIQTHRFLPLEREAQKMDREILFFPNNLSPEGEHEFLYNEFSPLETAGVENGKKDQDSH
jgi:hypothetical protein